MSSKVASISVLIDQFSNNTFPFSGTLNLIISTALPLCGMRYYAGTTIFTCVSANQKLSNQPKLMGQLLGPGWVNYLAFISKIHI